MDLVEKVYYFVKYAQLVGFTILLARLYLSRLNRTYPYFTVYVWVTVLRLVALAVVPYGKNVYGWVYVITEPVTWLACALAIVEVYDLVLKNHPGIATVGRKALLGCVGASVILSAFSLLLDFQNTAVRFPVLDNLYLLARLVMFSLLVFVLLITFCLLWFPIRLSKNAVMHCGVFAGYFMVKAGSFMVLRAFPELLPRINAGVQLLTALCCAVWILRLTPGGEQTPVTFGHSWDRAQEHRLMEQLNSINRTLVNSAKD
jgi:hypothetical protein